MHLAFRHIWQVLSMDIHLWILNCYKTENLWAPRWITAPGCAVLLFTMASDWKPKVEKKLPCTPDWETGHSRNNGNSVQRVQVLKFNVDIATVKFWKNVVSLWLWIWLSCNAMSFKQIIQSVFSFNTLKDEMQCSMNNLYI